MKDETTGTKFCKEYTSKPELQVNIISQHDGKILYRLNHCHVYGQFARVYAKQKDFNLLDEQQNKQNGKLSIDFA